MRGSRPIASLSSLTSAPDASHSSAIALMKLTFVARKAFDADLISSAVAKLQTRRGMPAQISGSYTASNTAVTGAPAAAPLPPGTP
ncbi:hypothetical protein D3C73_1413290 [compost metagenome]